MMMFRKASGSIVDEIQSDCFVALENLGLIEQERWRFRLAIPVEYSTGPRGGIVIVRSLPGESPRKETGNLQDSIQSSIESDARLITLTVDSDVFYGPILQDNLNRPHVPDEDEFLDAALDALISAIEGT